jgi:hypothetical protein
MTKSERENRKMGGRVQSPLSATHPLLIVGRKGKEEMGEVTNVVDKRKEKKKLVLTGIFRCYVLAVLFVEFMVFQGQSRP